ncbi:MAG: DUF1624 domain-containing protein [Clostridia bacterium]|nr:DUF1624 domain-containing protein [Clostridia bacterium]
MLFKGQTRETIRNYPTAERGSSRRIWELDFLRGFTIILMVIDHFMFDLAYLFSPDWIKQGGAAEAVARFAKMWWDHGKSWVGETRDVVQVIALCIFFGLCGGSTIFSRDNLTRAMKTFLAAAVITLGTYLASVLDIIDSYDIITFGVLHMLSIATLLVATVYQLTRLAKERGDLVFVIVSAVLAGLVFLADYLIGQADVAYNEWLLPLHQDFAHPALVGGDYFPLIPYLGYAFAGAAVITIFYGGGKSLLPKLDGGWNRPFRFVGRHTLLIVIAHQVVNMLLLALVTGLLVDFGNFVIF